MQKNIITVRKNPFKISLKLFLFSAIIATSLNVSAADMVDEKAKMIAIKDELSKDKALIKQIKAKKDEAKKADAKKIFAKKTDSEKSSSEKSSAIKVYDKPKIEQTKIKDLDAIAVKYDIMKLNYDLQSDSLKQDFPATSSPTNVKLSSDFKATPQGEICRAVKLVIDKSDRTLKLYYANDLQKTYPIRLGFSPKGNKVKRNDGKTPEGVYNVAYKNANSQFYKAFAVSYPSPEDRAKAAALGFDPGGDIMIHGLENKSGMSGKFKHWRGDDWTAGCIALTDEEIDELWKVVSTGTIIDIRP